MLRKDVLLGILSAADGQPFTPVQIQKATFLVSRNIPDIFDQDSRFNFLPYDYGPFDNFVYKEIDILMHENLASIFKSISGNWNEYAATSQGVLLGKNLLHIMNDRDRNYIERIVHWVRSQTFSQLVKSIYDAYPEMKKNSIFQG